MVVIEVVKVVLVVVKVAAGWQELTKKFASDACFLIYDNCIVFEHNFKFVKKTLFWIVFMIVLCLNLKETKLFLSRF